MHYSEILKNQTAEEKRKIARAEDVINTFRGHLNSSKFWNDTTIQTSDVHRWLDCVVRELRGE